MLLWARSVELVEVRLADAGCDSEVVAGTCAEALSGAESTTENFAAPQVHCCFLSLRPSCATRAPLAPLKRPTPSHMLRRQLGPLMLLDGGVSLWTASKEMVLFVAWLGPTRLVPGMRPCSDIVGGWNRKLSIQPHRRQSDSPVPSSVGSSKSASASDTGSRASLVAAWRAEQREKAEKRASVTGSLLMSAEQREQAEQAELLSSREAAEQAEFRREATEQTEQIEAGGGSQVR